MSFITGTNMELIYASTVPGAAKASFNTESVINDTATMGVQCHLPPDFWLPSPGQVARGLRIVARGIIGSVTSPNYTFSIRAGTAGSTSAVILLGSGLLAGANNTAQPWEIIGDVVLTSIGAAGANSTVRGMGTIKSPGLSPTIGGIGAGASLTTPTAATLDTSITNYINFNINCSAISATNSITLQSLQVYGLN
jgi:hypothetical protein